MPNNFEDLYEWAESVGLLQDDDNTEELSYEDTLDYIDSLSKIGE